MLLVCMAAKLATITLLVISSRVCLNPGGASSITHIKKSFYPNTIRVVDKGAKGEIERVSQPSHSHTFPSIASSVRSHPLGYAC